MISEYLLVDGYNIINAWTDLFNTKKEDFDFCRDRLLAMLSNYQGYKKSNIVVVFDAHLVKGGSERVEDYDNITVVYTKENETADSYIERFVYKMVDKHTIRVATADYMEQRVILNIGGIRMSARELKEEVLSVSHKKRQDTKVILGKSNTIMSNVSPELLKKLEDMRRGKF